MEMILPGGRLLASSDIYGTRLKGRCSFFCAQGKRQKLHQLEEGLDWMQINHFLTRELLCYEEGSRGVKSSSLMILKMKGAFYLLASEKGHLL